ncbi:MAG: T9SS type A sorting domain-containing protein [Bacteroidota bacterium]
MLQKLNKPLEKGGCYTISFAISLAEASQYYLTGTIGASLTAQNLDQLTYDNLDPASAAFGRGVIKYDPEVKFTQVFNDTDWVFLKFENYIAKGGEQYISIGNFTDSGQCVVTKVPGKIPADNFAYYYIDNVSIARTFPEIVADDEVTICAGESVRLQSEVYCVDGATDKVNNSVTYQWTPSLGVQNGNTKSPTVRPPVTTRYTLTVNPNGDKDCIITKDVTVKVDPKPTVTITADAVRICAGKQKVTLTAKASIPGGSYRWSNGATSRTITISPSQTQTYTVDYRVNSCAPSSSSILITVAPTPDVKLTASAEKICAGTQVVLTASGALTYSYDGVLSSGTRTVSPIITTTYTVTGTNIHGCQNTATVTIVVDPLPTGNIISSRSVCSGEPLTLDFSGSPDYRYVWTGENIANPTVTPTTAYPNAPSNGISRITTYSVNVLARNGCSVTKTYDVVVKSAPVANAGPQVIDLGCNNRSRSQALGGLPPATGGNGIYSYQWYSDPGTTYFPSATSGNVVASFNGSEQKYRLTVTSNGCSSSAVVVVVARENSLVNRIVQPKGCALITAPLITGEQPPATGGNGNYTYSWEYKGTTGWISSGRFTQHLSEPYRPGVLCYRRTAYSGGCSLVSNEICIQDDRNTHWPQIGPSDDRSFTSKVVGHFSVGTFDRNIQFTHSSDNITYGDERLTTEAFVNTHNECGDIEWSAHGIGKFWATCLLEQQTNNLNYRTHSFIVGDSPDGYRKGVFVGQYLRQIHFEGTDGRHTQVLDQEEPGNKDNNFILTIDEDNTMDLRQAGLGFRANIFQVKTAGNKIYLVGQNLQNSLYFISNGSTVWYFENVGNPPSVIVLKQQLVVSVIKNGSPSTPKFHGYAMKNLKPGVWVFKWDGVNITGDNILDGQFSSAQLSSYTNSAGGEAVYLTGTCYGPIINSKYDAMVRGAHYTVRLNSSSLTDIWGTLTNQLKPMRQLDASASKTGIYFSGTLSNGTGTITRIDPNGIVIFNKEYPGMVPFSIWATDNGSIIPESSALFGGAYLGTVNFDAGSITSTSPHGEAFINKISEAGIANLSTNPDNEILSSVTIASGEENSGMDASTEISEVTGFSTLQPLLYPNPAERSITLRFAETLPAGTTFEITNAINHKVGALVSSDQKNYTIDVSGYAAGLYFVRYTTADGKLNVLRFSVSH